MSSFKKLTNPSQEDWFVFWLTELKEAGYIEEWFDQNDIEPFVVTEPTYYTTFTDKVLYKGTARERIKRTNKVVTLLKGNTYTPDFRIVWTPKAEHVFFTELNTIEYTEPIRTYFLAEDLVSYIDVKAPPGYGSTNCSDVSFAINRNVLYRDIGVYINKVYNMPNKKVKVIKPYLWLSTFTPQRFFWTDKLTKERSISNFTPRSLEEFLK